MQVVRGQVVTPEELIVDGVLAHDGEHLTFVGPWSAAPAAVRESGVAAQPQRYLAPALVDLHNHGGGGISLPGVPSAREIQTAVAEHRQHGTGRMLGSLVTAPATTLLRDTAVLAEAAAAGTLAGIHIEGPFIAAACCGAQDPAHIIPGDPALTAALLEAGGGFVKTMTIAPETPNAREVISTLIAGGAIPSFGHTDADEGATLEIIEYTSALLAGSGRRATVTHLFNGMRPIHHRMPGPIPPALAAARRGEIVVELIGDGAHLHPGIVRDVFELVGADNIALITDAMAATGMPDGEYRLGTLDVVVADGVARLRDGDSIAGGTAHLLDVVRTSVAGGVPLVDAMKSATLVPARVIDPSANFGALRIGYEASFIELDEELRMIRG